MISSMWMIIDFDLIDFNKKWVEHSWFMIKYINIKVLFNNLCCLDDLDQNYFWIYNYQNGF
jgi:hypothetical protein